MPNTDVEPVDLLDLNGSLPVGGVGLCLSGGGYRAMLFHPGTRRSSDARPTPLLVRIASARAVAPNQQQKLIATGATQPVRQLRVQRIGCGGVAGREPR